MESNSPPRFAVIGGGALGCLFTGLIAGSGHDVTLVTRRSEVKDAILAEGLVIEDRRPDRQPATLRFGPVVVTDREVDRVGPVDLGIVATKSYEVEHGIRLAEVVTRHSGLIVTIQNGLRSADLVSRLGDRGVPGSTYQGGTHLKPGVVSWTFDGLTKLAPTAAARTRLASLADAVSGDGLPIQLVDDAAAMLWEKICLGIAGTVCGALLLPISVALRSPSGSRLIEAAREEALAAAEGIKVRIDADAIRARSEAVFATVRKSTASGSMMQSITSGRSETEADDISGSVVRAAEGCGSRAPVNEILTLILKARSEAAST